MSDERGGPGTSDGQASTQDGQQSLDHGQPEMHDESPPTGGRDRGSTPPDAPGDPAVCSYCGARFVDDELLALHRGLEHGPALDDREWEAYVDAVAAERDDLRLFRLQALVALLVIYFGFVLVYAFVL